MKQVRLSVTVTAKLRDKLEADAAIQTKLRRESLDEDGNPGLAPKTRISISMRAAEIMEAFFERQAQKGSAAIFKALKKIK